MFFAASGGWFQTNAYSDHGDPFEGTRRTFTNSNVTFALVPDAFKQPSGYAENPVNSYQLNDSFNRLNLNGEMSTFRKLEGAALTQGRRPVPETWGIVSIEASSS